MFLDEGIARVILEDQSVCTTMTWLYVFVLDSRPKYALTQVLGVHWSGTVSGGGSTLGQLDFWRIHDSFQLSCKRHWPYVSSRAGAS